MELLTIFYAMLAALTGVSVSEASSVRQPLVAAAQVEQVEVAMATARKLVPAVAAFDDHVGQAAQHQLASVDAATAPAPVTRQVAIIIFGRRHL